jgi:hypothetical protein
MTRRLDGAVGAVVSVAVAVATAVAAERAVVEPPEFFAVTAKRRRWPTSVDLTTYVRAVAFVMFTHVAPVESHDFQRYV